MPNNSQIIKPVAIIPAIINNDLPVLTLFTFFLLDNVSMILWYLVVNIYLKAGFYTRLGFCFTNHLNQPRCNYHQCYARL